MSNVNNFYALITKEKSTSYSLRTELSQYPRLNIKLSFANGRISLIFNDNYLYDINFTGISLILN